LYEALFGVQPNELIWESTETRFNPELFTHSIISLKRLANIHLLRVFNEKAFNHMDEKQVKA